MLPLLHRHAKEVIIVFARPRPSPLDCGPLRSRREGAGEEWGGGWGWPRQKSGRGPDGARDWADQTSTSG